MKKLILFFIILACGVFIYFKVQSLGSENSSFNRTTRFQLGKKTWVRTLLGLHNDGDARGWYFRGTGPLVIEIVRASDTALDDKAVSQFASLAQKYTGRSVLLFNEETIDSNTLTEADMAKVVSEHRHHEISGQPNLFVIYAKDFQRSGTEVGKTYKEYGIVLSDTRLREVTAAFPDSLDEYVESTLLHEFGHQLGLGHNDVTNCLMNEKVEKPAQVGYFSDHFTVTDFCKTEEDQLNAIKAQFKL